MIIFRPFQRNKQNASKSQKSDDERREEFYDVINPMLKNHFPTVWGDDSTARIARFLIRESYDILRSQILQLTEEKDKLQQQHFEELWNKDQKHKEIENKQNAELRETRQSLARAEHRHNEEMERQDQMYKRELFNLNTTLEQRDRTHAAQLSGLKAEHARIVEETGLLHAAEVSQLTHTFEEDRAGLITTHNQRVQRLQNEIEGLNKALLTRDDGIYHGAVFTTQDLPHKPDEKTRAQFSEVRQLVDELSRLSWKEDQIPWPNHLLQRASVQYGDRVVKRAIVQDLVWNVLFHEVFCSPFRILGEEGKALEDEWRANFGTAGSSNIEACNWPLPSIDAERWRYLTIKECRDALQKPASDWDPRARIKRAFQSSLPSLNEELKRELSEIGNLTTADSQNIHRLCNKAAVMWLDFQMHRCRIVVCLTGSQGKSIAEKVSLAERGSLSLTVSPLVGRHGNVKGAELETFKVIAGCDGDTLMID